MRAAVVVALAASCALLAGCTPAPALPAPITPEEARTLVYEQNGQWWEAMFPGEPRPEVEVVSYIDPFGPATEVVDCLRDTGLPGLSFGGQGWNYTSAGPENDRAVNLAVFVCSEQYPYDVSDPSAVGFLSDAEQEWILDYNDARLVPCLRLLGYRFPVSHERSAYWSPYYDMVPQPTTTEEWTLIDRRCPPSPVGPDLHPPVG